MAGRNRRTDWYLVGGVVAACVAGAPVWAADDGRGGPQAPTLLDPVSVTATKSPIEAFEYPGMTTTVGQEQLKLLQPSSVDDILKQVPNVSFTGGPRRSGETPVIRGFTGADVVVLFDGARQNFGSAHDGRFFVDPSLLRQVEVLRGPASSLYGSGGTGGVIEFRTAEARDLLNPGESYGANIGGGYQTANRERYATASAYGLPADGLDVLASVTRRASGSIELGDDTKLDRTDDDIVSGLFKTSYSANKGHKLEGSYLGFRNEAQEPGNPQGAGSTDVADKDIRSQTLRLGYGYSDPATALVDLDVVTYYSATQADELRLDGNGAGPAGELLRRDVDTVGLRIDNRSRAILSDDLGIVFTYGGEAYRDEQDGEASTGARDGVPDAVGNTYGVYGQALANWSEPFGLLPGDLQIIPGLRYDSFEASSSIAADNTDSALSPRLGVSYLPNDWLLVFANYAYAFRAPSFDELYVTGVHFRIPVGAGVTNRFTPNPNLKPQKTRTLEGGAGLNFKSVFTPRDQFRVKASTFRIRGEDFIETTVTQPTLFVACNPFIPGNCDGTTTLTNIPRAKLWGTEVETSYENERMLFSVGYSSINGRNDDTGARLGILGPDKLTVNSALKLPEVDSILGWRMLAANEFDKTDTASERRGGYAVHDFYYAWAPSDGAFAGFRVDLGVDNAFDKAYSRVFTGSKEAGRSFKAGLSYAVNW